MQDTRPLPIISRPGIKRDGTQLSGDFYTDGQWVRFAKGMPRKIGGFRRMVNDAPGIMRALHTQAKGQFVYAHGGHASGLGQFTIDENGNPSAYVSRTPVGFTASALNKWSLDAMYDATSAAMLLLAHAAPSATSIADDTARPIYGGNLYTGAALTASGKSVSGGLVVLHPFTLALGSDGLVEWSDAGKPTTFAGGAAGSARITASKLVKGLPLRGGGQSPAGLIWSLDSLIRASYVGGASIFSFDTITASTSIIAQDSAIEYNGVYYWIGLDAFQMFNGVVREVDNQQNIDWFFRELNYAHANKIFAFKVPRFGEIWWCFPRGSSTEPNHALILNVREGSWYDTALPGGGRSAGIYAQVYRSPLLAGVDVASGAYKVWRHETGVDEIDGTTIRAIQSSFTTHEMSALKLDQPSNEAMSISTIEPDFVQAGDLTIEMLGRANARADADTESQTIMIDPSTPLDQVVNFKKANRLIRFRVTSNAIGGDYELGSMFAHTKPAAGRVVG